MARPKGEPAPVPADFREVAATMGRRALAKHYGVSEETIYRWYAEIGGNPRVHLLQQGLPVPPDFARLAPTMTIIALQNHYEVGHRSVTRWIEQTGVKVDTVGNRNWHKKPVPEDFRDVAPTMTHRQLRAHYATGLATLARWIRETGVRTLYADTPNLAGAKASRSARPFFFRGHGAAPRSADLRTITMFDQAADVLRAERFVVYRCDQRGRADQKGEFWRLGNTLLTPDELLIRAAKYRKVAA